MNQLKTRLQALALLDRAFTAVTDDELEALVASLPDDHRDALDRLCGARDGSFSDPAARTLAMRGTAARGRMNGGLEQLTTLICDPCLADFIEALGDHSDNPTEAQLLEVTPALIEKHGLPTVRLTMAGSVAGEAAAAPTLIRLLKHHEELGLPPEVREGAVVLPAAQADEELRAKRRAAREQKKADANARRLQQLKAKKRA